MSTVRTLCDRASKLSGIRVDHLLRRDNSRPPSRVRQAIVYVARTDLNYSYHKIGYHLGRRDHSTIVEQYRRAEHLRTTNDEFAAFIERLRA
jgi:chromosomal replication initiation ATPase DnaA